MAKDNEPKCDECEQLKRIADAAEELIRLIKEAMECE